MAFLLLTLAGLLAWPTPGRAGRGDCATVSIAAWQDAFRANPDTTQLTEHGEAIATNSYCLDFRLDDGGAKIMRLTWRFAGFPIGYPPEDGGLFTDFSLRELELDDKHYVETRCRDLYMPRTGNYLSPSQYTKGADKVGFCVGEWPVLLHPAVERRDGKQDQMRIYAIVQGDKDISSYFAKIKQKLGCGTPAEILNK